MDALTGALLAVLGALAGYLGAIYIANRNRELTLTDALRAFERDRRAREDELLLGVRHEVAWNIEILHDAQAGERYGPTVSSSLDRITWRSVARAATPAASDGVPLGQPHDEAVRTLPPDFSGAPRQQMTPKVQEWARAAESYFNQAAQLLDEELTRRNLTV